MYTLEGLANQQEKENRENILTILDIIFILGVLAFVPSLIPLFCKIMREV